MFTTTVVRLSFLSIWQIIFKTMLEYAIAKFAYRTNSFLLLWILNFVHYDSILLAFRLRPRGWLPMYNCTMYNWLPMYSRFWNYGQHTPSQVKNTFRRRRNDKRVWSKLKRQSQFAFQSTTSRGQQSLNGTRRFD